MNLSFIKSPSLKRAALKQPLKKPIANASPPQAQIDTDYTDYWSVQLSGPLPPLEMPICREKTAAQSDSVLISKMEAYCFRLPQWLCDRIKALGQCENATPFMTLLSAFQTLLYRYTDQSDLLIGVSDRTLTPTVGQPDCPLPLRISLAKGSTFLSLLGQVREVTLAAQAHQTEPYENILKALQRGYGSDREPHTLFQTQFSLSSTLYNSTLYSSTPSETSDTSETFDTFDTEAYANNSNRLAQSFANSELSLHLCAASQPHSTDLTCTFLYSTDLFNRATISRMAGHFQTLLEAIVSTPEQSLSTLPMLTTAECHHLLHSWSKGSQPITKGLPKGLAGGLSEGLSEGLSNQPQRCVHELFELQAARSPESIAVSFKGEQISYQALNQQANQLAHYLQSRGVGPETPVGLCLERSANVIVAILAILKAGGAYVPLDPTTPPERLRYIWADSNMSVLITEASQASALLDGLADGLTDGLTDSLANGAIDVVNLESDRALIAQMPAENLACQVTPQNLAYLMYTSGTTGKPKGVLVTHFNTTRLFSETEQWFGFNEQDVWTLFHSYAFDFSVWEIWGALLYGGRLVIVPHEVSRWPKAFCQLLRAEKVTVLNQTPSAFRQVIRADAMMDSAMNSATDASEPLALRWIIFDGEVLDFQCLRPWFERYGDRSPQLVNMYGITETTVHVTYRPVRMADLDYPGSMIGQPIPDLQLYILDRHQQLVPVGIPGELYVGGAGLARGYLNRPELTAEKFIPSPFSPSSSSSLSSPSSPSSPSVQQANQAEPGDDLFTEPEGQPRENRLYKTGDWVCYRADGDIEYLGRMDHQVKIRGFRVELGAIESQLNQLAQVEAATVIVREDIADDQRLVAYVVAKQPNKQPNEQPNEQPDEQANEQILTASELRAALKTSLPDYMVPTAYVLLEALPLTSNGKIDRRSLPAPQASQQATNTEFVEPRTALEKQLLELWCESLNLERIGVFDSFFELGGHSLLATQIVSQVEEIYQQSLSLADFFQAPTIAAQAQLLSAETTDLKETVPWSSLVPMQSVADHNRVNTTALPAIFCIHGGGGSVLMYQALARHLSDRFAVYGLQSSYLNNPKKLLTTIEEMTELYLNELRSVQPHGPYLIAGYCGGAPIALEIAQRLRSAGETVSMLALFDPDAIRTSDSPRRPIAAIEGVRSLLSRLHQHGLKVVAYGRWLKITAWAYQRWQRPLTLSMRAVKVQAANMRAMQAYVATQSYPGPVTIFLPQQGLNPQGEISQEWKSLLTGEVNIQMVPGKHHFDESTEGSFLHEPAVRTLAIQLKQSIAAAGLLD